MSKQEQTLTLLPQPLAGANRSSSQNGEITDTALKLTRTAFMDLKYDVVILLLAPCAARVKNLKLPE